MYIVMVVCAMAHTNITLRYIVMVACAIANMTMYIKYF
jgi:hypothetical protein